MMQPGLNRQLQDHGWYPAGFIRHGQAEGQVRSYTTCVGTVALACLVICSTE